MIAASDTGRRGSPKTSVGVRLPSHGKPFEWRAHNALRALAALMRTGILLVQDAPVEPGSVLTVAKSFAHVRTTNYGDLFDVRVEAQPVNLAYTGRAIAPHTDNPYRDPVPGIQLLLCLQSSPGGGENLFLDGFAAAALIRRARPTGVRDVDVDVRHLQIRGCRHLAAGERTDHHRQRSWRGPRHPMERSIYPAAGGAAGGCRGGLPRNESLRRGHPATRAARSFDS